MRLFHFILTLVIATVLSGCYSVSARHSYDSETDFSGLNSYAWAPVKQGTFSTPESAAHYRITMDAMLAEKGFNLDPANPDFMIFTAPVATYREKYTTLYGKVHFPKAVLRISLFTPSSQVSLYEGAAEVYYDDSGMKQSEKNATIDEAIEALLKDFPPGD